MNCEIPYVQAGLRKDRGTRDQTANIRRMIEKEKDSRKTPTSALLTMKKPLIMWITTNCGKLTRREYQTTLPAFLEICMQVKKQQVELNMEQQTGSNLGKEYIKAVYCHLAYKLICRVHHEKRRAG